MSAVSFAKSPSNGEGDGGMDGYEEIQKMLMIEFRG